MSFALYIAGALIFIGGLIYGAVLLEVPMQWIAVGALVTLGLACLSAVKVTRQKDSGE
ncbi:hypothetical protein HNE05_07820 [Aquipseudomonas campi]|uniref:Uncharacterized protein n=1 Tax=Aquipseudomonas campi TaxID=2731681 RepID=A0A6M8FGL2_9GAMM|nr:hypothetical protein [Pseudomonas campi]QKE63270.1 hypothetical protein HNE05_07820 [Pseudomonas campi]